MKIPKIGMRTIKTVIAVVLTLEIAKLLNINSPLLAGIAAIMTMETSVSESFSQGKFRMYGTFLGAIVALIVTLILPSNFFTTAIGLIIIISSSNMLGLQNAVKMAMIVFLVIILNYEEGHRFIYALNRTIDTFIGVIVGTTINYFVKPPKIDIKIYNIIEDTIGEINGIIEELIWGKGKFKLDQLREKIDYIEENYETFQEDLKFKKNPIGASLNYQQIFELFQNIYSHLRIIRLINKTVPLNRENKELLEEKYMRNTIKLGPIEEEIYNIYNYHLRRVIYDLRKVERLNKDGNIK